MSANQLERARRSIARMNESWELFNRIVASGYDGYNDIEELKFNDPFQLNK